MCLGTLFTESLCTRCAKIPMATNDYCHKDKKDVVVARRCGCRRVSVSVVFVSECGCFVSERQRRHFLHQRDFGTNQKIMVILVQQAEDLPSAREGVFAPSLIILLPQNPHGFLRVKLTTIQQIMSLRHVFRNVSRYRWSASLNRTDSHRNTVEVYCYWNTLIIGMLPLEYCNNRYVAIGIQW